MARTPAYRQDPPVRRVSRGSVSHPSDPKGTKYTRLAQDATPKVVSRGTVSNPSN